MSETVNTPEQATPQVEQPIQASQEATNAMAESLWGVQPTVYTNPDQPAPQPEGNQPPAETPIPQTQEADDIIDLDVYFQREYGMNPNDFKSKWEELNKPKEQTAQEVKWSYDDSKEDEIYNYINQKRQLEKLEKYDIANADQAAEIIRANLQFKYKDLSSQEIDRLFTRQYSLPQQPQQSLDQSDDDYAMAVDRWKQQVEQKQLDMIIDAKLAKPEIAQYKSQIVLPEIQKPQARQEGPTPEELAAFDAARKAYLAALESSYQNFKGFTVTAKDGDVQLPISYNVSPEEIAASKQELEDFSINAFVDKRWWDEKGNPHVTVMQEDLYLLKNKEKIFQKVANEAAAQMKAHLIKTQNNINLKGVNTNLGPLPSGSDAPKNTSQILAENIWSM